MKKLLSLLMAAICVAIIPFATGCGKSGNGGLYEWVPRTTAPTAAQLTANGNVNLTVWIPNSTNEELYTKVYKPLIDEFKVLYPGVNVTHDIKGEDVAVNSVAQDPDAAADVFFFPSDQLLKLVSGNLIVPLPEYAELGDANFTANGQKLFDGVVNRDSASSYEFVKVTDVKFEGTHVYAFPATEDNTYFLYYNKDVFPTAPTSMDQILSKCNENNAKFYMDPGSFFIASYFFGNDMGVGTAFDGTKFCDFNGAKGAQAAEAMYDMMHSGRWVYGDTLGNFVDSAPAGSKVIAAVEGSWSYKAMVERLGDKLGMTVMPTVSYGGTQKNLRSFMGGKYAGVNSASKNIDAAIALANYLTGQRAQQLRLEQWSTAPSNKNVAASSAAQNDPLIKVVAAQAAKSYTQGAVPDSFWDALSNFGKQIENAATKPTEAQFLQMVDTLRNDILG